MDNITKCSKLIVIFLGVFLLYEADNFHYYKIPVAFGTTMKNGEVSRACHSFGMEAVCMGPSGCKYNSDNCRITPLSTACTMPMNTLSQLICDGKYPKECPMMDHMFAEHNDKYNQGKGACGTVGSSWCVKGDSYTSTQGTPLYAYCTKDSTAGKLKLFNLNSLSIMCSFFRFHHR